MCLFCKKTKTKTHFFYFTHQFLQNTHLRLSILKFYSIKYHFFYTIISLRLDTTHPTTIIKQLASIINPLNHHHQATNLYRQPTQIPTQPSHHQWNPNTHSTQLPSMKSKYSSNPAIVQQDRHLPLSDHGSSDASMPTMVRQHRIKLTKLWSTPSTSHPRCVKAHDA